ncbi:MAG: rhodanese-like domain-containing protein [Candidatus Anaerobiospirillum merdipullorum]|uniref:Rhodanese-like domain-containing protein n=1 Tax=Candidatus Anaerobiospirillum merdipullorum TaxID=2838450 RepID=A0A9E2NS32_9GAMM|nr:rhodanese-like domain-containing protein [Candidatus Anaerobiospirillum merdipullorum]
MTEIVSPDLWQQFSAFFTRHYMMCGGWLVVVVLLVVVQFKLMTARIKKTTTNSAVIMVNRQEGIFVDVRSADKFGQGHIANAVNVTATDIKNGKLQRIERNKDKPVIIVGKDKYDTDCFNSARALKKSGFTQVYVLEGGILEWDAANLPLTTKR